MRRRGYQEDLGAGAYGRSDSLGSDGLNEPLLPPDSNANSNIRYQDDEDDDDWSEKRRKEESAWAHIFSSILAQWVHFLASILQSSGSWIGQLVFRNVSKLSNSWNEDPFVFSDLTYAQEESLRKLQHRLEVPFDGTTVEHQEALRTLWQKSFPDRQWSGLVSDEWKEMGWQGKDPSTDFRGGGFVSLENLLFLAENYPNSFQRLLHKHNGRRPDWDYPFAVAGINLSFTLIQMLDLRSMKPNSICGANFRKILAEDEMAFDRLYCVAFEVLDANWLAMRASYMEFNSVLKATQVQLERELSLQDVSSVADLPAYNLLHHS